MKTTEQKEKELNGKRYKIISISIESSKQKGEEISNEMEIDLHHSWMETMNQIRKGNSIAKKRIEDTVVEKGLFNE
jgi:predicted RND superfamily exporter protein